jgi:formylglycine-generating enzyme required for sulfatase activity
MVWIPGGEFIMGTSDAQAYDHEKPAHKVRVSGFWMDRTEVTNKQFAKFVNATGYVTVAERKPDWEELKKQLPANTPKPHDSLLVPGSLKFQPPCHDVSLNNYAQWWSWTPGASWKHPEGKTSSIEEKDDFPVVHIAYEDAVVYCEWAGKSLPTEAEWEFAAKGGKSLHMSTNGIYVANTFQGEFPNNDVAQDGFASASPVKSFPANDYGLYDMIGNVWELTSDLYHAGYYDECAASDDVINDPQGARESYDPQEPGIVKHVTKGGSFLCASNYCSNYRPSARQATAYDSGQSHIGFRCVKRPGKK